MAKDIPVKNSTRLLTMDIQNINTVQYRKKELQNKRFKVSRFFLSFHPYGSIWYRNVIYFLQFFIFVPVAFIFDLVFLIVGFVLRFLFDEIKNLWKGAKQLTGKLLYDLLKALIKPFAILTSVFIFGVIMYSLIKEITITEGFEIIIEKLF